MISHQEVLILGAGESGVGAAILARKKGKNVFVSDFGEIKEKFKKELREYNIPFEEKGHDFEKLKQADLVIKSPGIPEKARVIQELRKLEKLIVSEIEYASWYNEAKLIAVTGSNGKTTTASILFHVLNTLGEDVALGGNIGTSFCRIISEDVDYDMIVLEASSFQLDDIVHFKPDIAILLNISADHLDRYDYEIKKYARSKVGMFRNMKTRDVAIINQEDHWTKVLRSEIKCQVIECSELTTQNFETQLKGSHNQFNIACAMEALKAIGLEEHKIREKVRSFKAVKHRLETVAIIDGVEYINDSKATNVDAVKYALDGITKPIVWIAGGTDKGNDYTELQPLIKKKVKTLICLGVDNNKLKESFQDSIEHVFETQDIGKALEIAREESERGDVVLLSPACASFDLFENYEDRGMKFEEAVFALLE